MRGAMPPLPQYAFMLWCLVKHRDKFTFYLYSPYLEAVSSIHNPRTRPILVTVSHLPFSSKRNVGNNDFLCINSRRLLQVLCFFSLCRSLCESVIFISTVSTLLSVVGSSGASLGTASEGHESTVWAGNCEQMKLSLQQSK
jgi:hypothetical protein